MGSSDADVTETVARHEREIADLRAQVNAIQDGHAREQLEAQIAGRLSELEADLKLMELQEALVKEGAAPQRRRWILHKPW